MRAPAFSHNRSRRRLRPTNAPPKRPPTIITTSPSGRVTATGPGAKKAAATARYRQRANAPLIHAVSQFPQLPTPLEAYWRTLLTGDATGDPMNPGFSRLGQLYGPKVEGALREAAVAYDSHHGAVPTEDLTNAIMLGTGLGGIARFGGELLAKQGAKTALKEAASVAAKAGASEATQTGGKQSIRALLGAVAKKAEPTAVRDVRQVVSRGAASAAERVPAPLRTAGRAAGKGAAFPVKHPFTAPLSAQVPAFAVSGGDPKQFMKALEGTGTFASIANTAGNAAASVVPTDVAKNIVKDAFQLPSAVLPSAYLTVAGAIEASQGNPQKLDALWKSYKETGVLPAVFGNGDVLDRIKNHPLFSALELSGAEAALGRGAGAVLRNASRGRVAGTERPPVYIKGLEHYGNVNEILGRGRYSPDVIRQLLQRAYDQRRGVYATAGQEKRVLGSDLPNRFAFGREQVRRVNRYDTTKAIHDARPQGRLGKTDRASAGVVSLAVQKIIRSPQTFFEDLRHYREQLVAEAKSGNLTKAELKDNAALTKAVDAALKHGNPEAVVKAANAFIEHHGKLVDQLVKQGLLDHQQAQMAAAIPFARVHMGASYGRPSTAALERQLAATRDSGIKVVDAPTRADFVPDTKPGSIYENRIPFIFDRETGVLHLGKRGESHGDMGKIKGELAERPTKSIQGEIEFHDAYGKGKAGFKYGSGHDQLPEAEAVRHALEAKTGLNLVTAEEVRGKAQRLTDRLKEAERAPGRVLDRNGNPLKLEDIQAEMARRGVSAPGFLTHRPRTPSAGGAFYRAFFPDRQKIPTGVRTGQAVARGTFDASYRALAEQAIRSRSIVDATTSFDELVKQYGVRAPEGVKSLSDAQDALRRPENYGWDPPAGLKPIRTAPFNALKRELDAAGELQALNPEDSPVLESMAAKALSEASREGDGPIAYIPESTFNRLTEHFSRSKSIDKFAQLLNTQFKGAVLPFSPSFYVGNAVDNYLRAFLAGIGPTDVALGYRAVHGKTLLTRRKVTEPLPTGATESILPGALYGSIKRINPYRDARQFQGSKLEGFAKAMNALHESPGPKQAVSAFTHTRNFLMEVNSRLFERLPQYGAIGKELRRELQAKKGYWHHALMISDAAFRDLTDGLRYTPKQIQFAKAVEQVFGNWGKNGPAARSALAEFVPFWQWGRAATRLVAMTLPAHHPIKTAILAAAAEMTEEERKRFGLDQFAQEPLPGFLQGNIPLGGGVTRNLSKYSSFGVFGDYPEFIGRLFFAQGSTPLAALQGLDWKGDRLEKADGTPAGPLERTQIALLTGAEQFIPGINLIEAAAENDLGKFNPLATEKGEKLDFLRGLSKSQTITVPAKGSHSGGSSAGDFTSGYYKTLQGSQVGDFAKDFVFSGGQ